MRNSTASSGDDWTIIKLLEWTTSYFASRAIESPRAGAEILLAHVLNLQRVDLYLRHDQPYDCAGSAKIESLGVALVLKIESDDPTALIGLPLMALVTMLQREGVAVI